MTDSKFTSSLRGQLLIATPKLTDPNFHSTVCLICEHNEQGSMGLVINQPTEITLQEIFSDLDVDPIIINANKPVLAGGPVSGERGFVLHDGSAEQWQSSISVTDFAALTASREIIGSLAQEKGPESFLMVLGYSGWAAGQLEAEIEENAWLTVPATHEILFQTPVESRYSHATNLAGFDITRLAPDAGHA